jgi:PAT family beta-lactamase induction signal transducer AmpG
LRPVHTFISFIRPYSDRQVLAIGLIAYANGLPLLLTAKTLGVWLKSYGLDYMSIGLFGLMHIPYTIKFLWAPLLDQVPLPFLKQYLGQRRSWLCLVQITAIIGLSLMTFLDPIQNVRAFVACGVLVSISAASQHVLLLTYQMETLQSRNWGIGEGMGVFGYRMAILTSGAGALYLATYFTWKEVYIFMTFLMSIGLFAVLIMREPDSVSPQYSSSLQTTREWIRHAMLGPIKDFMAQQGWKAILVFMLIYRLPEHLLGMMQPLFLLDLGFTYIDISNVAKVFGLGATILGGLMGGHWIRLHGYKTILFWGALAHGLSCLLFLVQGRLGTNIPFLYLTIGTEHFFSGVALTSFFSYQLTCCNLRFAATQLALLTSLAALSRTLCAPLGGSVVEYFGWTPYLVLVFISAVPGVLWVYRIPFSRP